MASTSSSNTTLLPQTSPHKPARPGIALDLPRYETMALAHMVERLDRSECERLSSGHDRGEERDAMIVVDKLHAALTTAGYNPR